MNSSEAKGPIIPTLQKLGRLGEINQRGVDSG